jgi:hypothetical protein
VSELQRVIIFRVVTFGRCVRVKVKRCVPAVTGFRVGVPAVVKVGVVIAHLEKTERSGEALCVVEVIVCSVDGVSPCG